MRFHVVQRFDNPLAAVEAALVDPAFLARLGEIPELGWPRLLDQRVSGCVVTQQVRYQFAGHVSAAVAKVVDPAKLSWIEVSCLDRRTHRTEHRILPEHYPTRLQCSYLTELQPTDGTTERVADGELVVRFPLVGGKVERAIVSGLYEHAALEGQVMAAWLADHGVAEQG